MDYQRALTWVEKTTFNNQELKDTLSSALQIAMKEPKPTKTRCIANKPLDVDDKIWSDFVAQRKKSKAEITETAIKLIRNEALKANWSMDDALSEICTRGWRSFKAEWVDAKEIIKPKIEKNCADFESLTWQDKLKQFIPEHVVDNFLGDAEFKDNIITAKTRFKADFIKQKHTLEIEKALGKNITITC